MKFFWGDNFEQLSRCLQICIETLAIFKGPDTKAENIIVENRIFEIWT